MLWRAILLFAAGVALAACTTKQEDRIGCPSVEVLRDLGEVTRFNPGPGRDPTDVRLHAWIDRVSGKCSLDGNDLLVDLSVRIVASRGPANRSQEANVPYFVAISDRSRNILNRRTFDTKASYLNRKSVSFEDVLTLTIPMTPKVQPESFVIYVGLELSKDELAHNRHKNDGQ
jgi:hypothetical protein